MGKNDNVENWAVLRAQQILMREGMDLAVSARDANTGAVRAKGKLLAMAIAASLMEASAASVRAEAAS
ncbi:hypothetical protein C8J35_103271 [Rhizobium sp. PP-F2F-G38]|uniref:Uncharacterized protein n=1 Tax=Ferranicluibacter rubi TaxID=2715133 RepID=A0AA43ZCS5_9HYPH|nr:hypothetical protein [Ferranicluibacter rubi]PYE34866.1 hypothetical protein C8J37_103191 [Rhizobium sp. PP-WC-1G-195]PYE98672.1 hypothetical protein C8J35_103271 [Rhizobium sp. PP-F2F-G38]TCP89499.1 hypothetical protein C8J31_102678 [Rhizobium sp. PP-CC-2G-626]TCQ11635.1 hypothetical protein C8J34_101264 [Rhizobium sp. PP-F2F-G36]TCQ29592.1 hypothetical protein C8J33_1012261 [Rhizobium sp. PP-CC-3G-465]